MSTRRQLVLVVLLQVFIQLLMISQARCSAAALPQFVASATNMTFQIYEVKFDQQCIHTVAFLIIKILSFE